MIPYLDCRAAQLLLEAFVDGELSVHDQVALESHLRWCRVCAARVEDMQVIGASLRVTSCALRTDDAADESLASVESEVLTRIQTEREQAPWARLRSMCSDMRFFWPAVGASLALVAWAAQERPALGGSEKRSFTSAPKREHILLFERTPAA